LGAGVYRERLPEVSDVIAHAILKKPSPVHPKSSAPIKRQPNGALEVPAKRHMSPHPDRRPIGRGIIKDKALPRVAPIKKRGVTSPPLKPALKIKVVRRSLPKKKGMGTTSVKARVMVGMPKPANSYASVTNTIPTNIKEENIILRVISGHIRVMWRVKK
jgi:hypothetical protein